MAGSSSRRQTMLNTIGTLVLVLGLAGASLVLVRGLRQSSNPASSNSQDDTLSVQDSKASSYEVERYDGTMGMLTVRLSDALHRPESLAMIIATASTLVALGCFFVSRHLPPDPPIGTKDYSS
jgi:hypothetical protein